MNPWQSASHACASGEAASGVNVTFQEFSRLYIEGTGWKIAQVAKRHRDRWNLSAAATCTVRLNGNERIASAKNSTAPVMTIAIVSRFRDISRTNATTGSSVGPASRPTAELLSHHRVSSRSLCLVQT